MFDDAALAAAARLRAQKHQPSRSVHDSVRRFCYAAPAWNVLFPPLAGFCGRLVQVNVIVGKNCFGLRGCRAGETNTKRCGAQDRTNGKSHEKASPWDLFWVLLRQYSLHVYFECCYLG